MPISLRNGPRSTKHSRWSEWALEFNSLLAKLDAQDFANSSLHYTGVHTVSRTDDERLKSVLLDCLAEFNRISGPSEPEEGVAFTFDYFKI
jgi:hypothetical protein